MIFFCSLTYTQFKSAYTVWMSRTLNIQFIGQTFVELVAAFQHKWRHFTDLHKQHKCSAVTNLFFRINHSSFRSINVRCDAVMLEKWIQWRIRIYHYDSGHFELLSLLLLLLCCIFFFVCFESQVKINRSKCSYLSILNTCVVQTSCNRNNNNKNVN